MTRYRLRFLLQELDLPLGVTTIGRSVDCHVTLDDPLVSRRHARVVVGDDRALVEDTGSRNGVALNGTVIRAPTRLHEGDRVRIGTQEFVFCTVHTPAGQAMPSRTTGKLLLCAHCHKPYPREVVSCPECEATEQVGEDTLTGSGSPGAGGASGVQLLVEALKRALAVGRVGDAQRLVRRAMDQVGQLVAAGGAVDAQVLAAFGEQAAELTAASHDPTWALWVLDMYCRTRQVPPLDVVERLAEVGQAAAERPAAVRDAFTDLLAHLRAPSGAPDSVTSDRAAIGSNR
jgi:hypothetical protein